MAKSRLTIPATLLFLLLCVAAKGQQEGLFSAQSGNWFLRNPAISGWEDYIDVQAGYRRQWLGTPQGPEGYYLTAHAPLNYFEQRGASLPMLSKYSLRQKAAPAAKKAAWYRHGIGGTLLVQNNRPFRTNIAQASYAIHFKVAKKARMSLGINLGIRQWRVNIDDLLLGNEDDPAFEPSFISEIAPSAGVGLLLYHPRYFVSLASSQVLEENISLSPGPASGGVLERHYYLGGGYKLRFNNSTVSPQVMLRYLPSIGWANDFLIQFQQGSSWWASIGYRQAKAFGIQAGYALQPWMRVSYTYELTSGTAEELGRHTHEITLRSRIAVRQYGIEQRYF